MSTTLSTDDLRLIRWCVFTISKGFTAERSGQDAAFDLLKKIDAGWGGFIGEIEARDRWANEIAAMLGCRPGLDAPEVVTATLARKLARLPY